MQLTTDSTYQQLEAGNVYLGEDIDIPSLDKKSWKTIALNNLAEKIGSKDFPCLFAKKAWKQASIQLLFCEKKTHCKFEDLLSGMMSYTNYAKSTKIQDRIFSPLVIFLNHDLYDSGEQHAAGWEALNSLHQHDPCSWPESVPSNPDETEWSFCFNGIQLFVNMSSSDHKILQSRNLGPYLTLVVNPRENFDYIASNKTKSGQLVRQQIRSRLTSYNEGVTPKELGFFGEKGNLEWQQYQLSEEGLTRPDRCPFNKRAILNLESA